MPPLVHSGQAKNVGGMRDPCNVGTACDYRDRLYRKGDWLQRVPVCKFDGAASRWPP